MEPTPGSTLAALALVESALAGIDHAQRDALRCAERLELVSVGRRVLKRLDALVLVLVGEADHANASMIARGTPLSSWLALTGDTSSREAAGIVFAGKDLTRNPTVQEAAVAGQVSVGQARSIVKVLDELPTLDAGQQLAATRHLVAQAGSKPAKELRGMADAVLRAVAPAKAPSPAEMDARLAAQRVRALSRRSLTWRPDGEGSVWFEGSLPVLEAETFTRLIDAHVQSDRRQGRDHAADRNWPGSMRSLAQRRADALMRLLREHQRARRTPRLSADRPRIVITMREADLQERAVAAGVLASGEPIPAGELRRLLCDADLIPAILGGPSAVLDWGLTHRTVRDDQRQALGLRDGQCQFPRCSAPDAQCDAHHVLPWQQGGRTDLDNLILLCPHHHGLCEPRPPHPDGNTPDQWDITRNEEGFTFLPPRTHDARRTPLPANGPPCDPPP